MRAGLLLLACLLGCTARGTSTAPAPAPSPSNKGIASAGRLVLDTIDAPAVAANLYGDPPRVLVAVYLPPSYAASPRRRFPALYVLHGYTHTLAGEPVPNPHTRWLLGPFGMAAIDSLIHARALRELIIVVPNATSRYGAGTFYTNSEAAGQWETLIAHDLLGYVDRHYRTLTHSASRGIAGGSGGGYGAFKLAMKRPDLFGAVYAQSPCCLGTAALAYDQQAWRTALRLTRPDQVPDAAHPQDMLLLGLAAAFSPDPQRPPLFVNWPFELLDGVRRPVKPAYARWRANLPLEVLPHYASNLRRLRGIAFDVGRSDQYAFIPITCRELNRVLTALRVRHVFEEY